MNNYFHSLNKKSEYFDRAMLIYTGYCGVNVLSVFYAFLRSA